MESRTSYTNLLDNFYDICYNQVCALLSDKHHISVETPISISHIGKTREIESIGRDEHDNLFAIDALDKDEPIFIDNFFIDNLVQIIDYFIDYGK